MKLVVFGLSLSSSWGNGHATTYRSLLRAFADRGHEISFYEWDAPWYSGDARDLASPDFARLILYREWETVRQSALADAKSADAVIVGSYVRRGPTIIDELHATGARLFYYDIDTPVTVAGLRDGSVDYLRRDQIPLFECYLSFTGGPFLEDVIVGELCAHAAAPLYCSVDPERYRRITDVNAEFEADLAYMGTYAADRQPVVDRFLIDVAQRAPDMRFIVAGPQYPNSIDWPANVTRISHLPPARHAAFYSSARWQLNATRADMVAAGWSPSVRLFEAGAAGAAIISDYWPGIDQLFTPGREIVLPESTDDVLELLIAVSDPERQVMGEALRERILAEHSSSHRAEELENYLKGDPPRATVPAAVIEPGD